MFYKQQCTITGMDTYREECLKAKRVREGIVELRLVPIRKRKKIDKPWTVYVLWPLRVRILLRDRNPCSLVAEYEFAKEDQAVRFADKKRREYYTAWVANNEGRK